MSRKLFEIRNTAIRCYVFLQSISEALKHFQQRSTRFNDLGFEGPPAKDYVVSIGGCPNL